MINKFTKFILALILPLFLATTTCAKQEENLTGGLSRVRIENTVIEVEGGFIRSLNGNEAYIWLLGPSAQIKLSPWAKSSSPQKLQFKIGNLYAPRMSVEGVEKFAANTKEISFNLELAPGQSKQINLKTLWNEPIFQFVVMGDNRDNPPVFKKIIQMINQQNPLFIMLCGDFVPGGKPNEYAEFVGLIKDSKYPIFLAPGNHDIPGAGKQIYNELFGPEYYSFQFANNNFVVLNNAWEQMDDNQYRWLNNELAANTNLRSILFMHVPPFTIPLKPGYWTEKPLNLQWLSDLIVKYKVETVFASHFHGYWETKTGATKYFVTGGGGAPLHQKNGFFHYLLVTVKPNEIITQVIKVE